MGGTAWSDDHYKSRAVHRKATGTDTFAYHAAVSSGSVAAKAHDSLDPKRVAGPKSAFAGQNIREARDSEAHPQSNAVVVALDVTGSMSVVPKIMQEKLVTLMNLLLQESYLTDPAICVLGVGDAYSDRVPMQIGQFESGIEIEDDLTNLYLEGAGGGQVMESYDLALYFLARKTAVDCFEKRGKKGYAFIIGDEMAYKHVKKEQVASIFGDSLQEDIPIADIIQEAKDKWDIYFIIPKLSTHYDNKSVEDFWRGHFGQQVIKLEDPNGISELIASLVGHSEEVISDADVKDALVNAGTELAVADAVSRAVATVGKGGKTEVSSIAGTGVSGF